MTSVQARLKGKKRKKNRLKARLNIMEKPGFLVINHFVKGWCVLVEKNPRVPAGGSRGSGPYEQKEEQEDWGRVERI